MKEKTPFDERLLDFYLAQLKSAGGPIPLYKKVKTQWIDKYLKQGITNQFITSKLVAGNIYIFQYTPINKTLKTWDRTPILLSLGQYVGKNKMEYEFGIDLNLIPLEYRWQILDRIWVIFKGLLQKTEQINQMRKLPLDYDTCKRILAGTGFEGSLWNFHRTKITNIRVLKYSDWWWPLAWIPEELTGLKTQQIKETYIKKMKG